MLRRIKSRLHRAGGSFAYREFRLFYVAVVSASMGNQIQRITDLWLVYELTDSPLFLGLTGLARGIPIVVFSVGGGLIADRVDRKQFIMVMQLASALANLLLAVLIATGVVHVWHIFLISMVSSSFVAISAPARTAITPSLVPRELLVNAFAFTSTAWKLAQLIGPAVAGLMIAYAGTSVTYGFNGCVYLGSAVVLTFMSYRSVAASGGKSALKSLIEALSFIKRESVIAVLVAMDVVAVFFGAYRILLPVIAAGLGMGAEGFGFFASAPAVGALLGAATVMACGDFRYKGLVVAGAILGYAACLAGLAVSPWFLMSLAHVDAARLLRRRPDHPAQRHNPVPDPRRASGAGVELHPDAERRHAGSRRSADGRRRLGARAGGHVAPGGCRVCRRHRWYSRLAARPSEGGPLTEPPKLDSAAGCQ